MPVHARGAHDGGGHDTEWTLKVAALATLAFSAAELAAGSYAQSLALVSDAWHNFSDALVLLVTGFAYYVQTKAPSQRRTYGYHRVVVLAAFVVALSLLGLVGVLFYEGYRRLLAPPEPHTVLMMVMGTAGIAMHAVITAALRRSSPSQATPPSVLIHMAGDTLSALGIVLAAVLIRATGVRAADPALGILIAGLIVWTAWDLVAESLNILLEGLPRGMNLAQVAAAIRDVPGVEDVHDLHIWSLGAHTQALSCHVRIPDIPLPESEAILREVNAVLEREFQICHTTVQLEHAACEAVNGCSIPAIPLRHPHPH